MITERPTCIAICCDFRDLFDLGRRLVSAHERPLLATSVGLAEELASRSGVEVLVLCGEMAVSIEVVEARRVASTLKNGRLLVLSSSMPDGPLDPSVVFLRPDVDGLRLRTVIDSLKSTDGIVGMVSGITIDDFVQLQQMRGASRAITVSAKNLEGLIVIKDGKVVHASTGQVHGEVAFYTLCNAARGNFQEVPVQCSVKSNVAASTTSLLMEAMRLRDEDARSGSVDAEL